MTGQRLRKMRTWAQWDEVYMLTAWADQSEGATTRYVLQCYRDGEWKVARSWAPDDDRAATAVARVALRDVRAL